MNFLAGAKEDVVGGSTRNAALWGGEGDDILMGFTASDEARQSLNAGESDNDTPSFPPCPRAGRAKRGGRSRRGGEGERRITPLPASVTIPLPANDSTWNITT